MTAASASLVLLLAGTPAGLPEAAIAGEQSSCVFSEVDDPPRRAHRVGSRTWQNGYSFPLQDNEIRLEYDASMPLWAREYTDRLWADLRGPLRAIVGPPSAGITVTVTYDNRYGAGAYVFGENLIVMAFLPEGAKQGYYNGQFAHELVHAFQDAALEQPHAAGWCVEGIAVVATALVAEEVQHSRQLLATSRSLGELATHYDNLCQAGPAALAGEQSLSAGVSPLHSYVAAGGLWWLLITAQSEAEAGAWTEYSYLARFCECLYGDELGLNAADVLRTIEATAPRPVDGLPARDWVLAQPITATDVAEGSYLFAALSDPLVLAQPRTFLFVQPFRLHPDRPIERLHGQEALRIRAWNALYGQPCWDLELMPRPNGENYQVVLLPDSLTANAGAYLIEVDATRYGAGKVCITAMNVPGAGYRQNGAEEGTPAVFYNPRRRVLLDPPYSLSRAIGGEAGPGGHLLMPVEVSRIPASFDVLVEGATAQDVLTRTQPLPYRRVLRLDMPGADPTYGWWPRGPFAGAAPNPTRGSVDLVFGSPVAGIVTGAVFDLRGRVLRHLRAGKPLEPVEWVRWDGSDDQGHQVPSGRYWIELSATSGPAIRSSVTIVR